ncbi:hypothetical protein ABZ401_28785 [Streptomyces sp. NPDC005892]|uniref:hypothetical protein n=1 Tax=Streptomyces sp. NPDC005892 TaxID=3155593 RepID=UPI0034038393
MTGRHRGHPHHAAPVLVRSELSNRLALGFLAVVGLVGPACALREHVGPLLEGAGYRPAAIASEASLPHPASGR